MNMCSLQHIRRRLRGMEKQRINQQSKPFLSRQSMLWKDGNCQVFSWSSPAKEIKMYCEKHQTAVHLGGGKGTGSNPDVTIHQSLLLSWNYHYCSLGKENSLACSALKQKQRRCSTAFYKKWRKLLKEKHFPFAGGKEQLIYKLIEAGYAYTENVTWK